MAKTPVVDHQECISGRLWVEVSPEVFRLNDGAVSKIYNPAGAPEKKIQEALDSCPVPGIHWE